MYPFIKEEVKRKDQLGGIHSKGGQESENEKGSGWRAVQVTPKRTTDRKRWGRARRGKETEERGSSSRVERVAGSHLSSSVSFSFSLAFEWCPFFLFVSSLSLQLKKYKRVKDEAKEPLGFINSIFDINRDS